MKRNSVKVCVRTRPTQNFAQDNLFIEQEYNTIQVNTSAADKPVGGILDNKQSNFKFKFDHVFHNASQSEVYDLYARDTVVGVVDGVNGAVMSYGQTGSGKTFTMLGDVQNYEHRGVAPRSIGQLFGEVNSRIEFEFRISCTFMEIYNERIFDLLADLSNPDQAADYTIAEEKDGRGTFVRGLAEVEVKDENDALNLLFSGGLSRTIATHKLNKRSNRSHSIFTIYLQQRQRSGVSEKVVHSKLHLVDLAGSERLKKTMDSLDGSMGDEITRKESMAINQSLTYLEQCVVALSRRTPGHIPYRQSKLTNILKDCLGANCNTVMVACIWGESSHLEETVSTLRLASRMMRVQNETVSVETIDPSALIKKQEKIIKALKQELLMHDALVERTGVAYDPYTPEQQESISLMIEKYVDAPEIEEEGVLNITNYRQMLEICKQFKKKLLSARTDARVAQEQAYMGYAQTPTNRTMFGGLNTTGLDGAMGDGVNNAADAKLASDFDPRTAKTVGEPVSSNRSGFSLGVANSTGGPAMGIEGAASRYASAAAESKQGSGVTEHGAKSTGRGAGSKGVGPHSPDRSVEFASGPGGGEDMSHFEDYCRTDSDGKQLYALFVDNKALLRDIRSKCKDLTASVNVSKSEIDRLQTEIEARKTARIDSNAAKKPVKGKGVGGGDVVDEEEFRLTKEMKEAKMAYKNCFEQLQKYKSLTSEAQHKVESSKSDLSAGFATWSRSRGLTVPGSMGSYGRGNFSPPSSPTTRRGPRSGRSVGATPGGELEDTGEGFGATDQLDDQEAFDLLEEQRVLSSDPDSLAFFHAQKTRRAHVTQKAGTLKQMQKNKRFG